MHRLAQVLNLCTYFVSRIRLVLYLACLLPPPHETMYLALYSTATARMSYWWKLSFFMLVLPFCSCLTATPARTRTCWRTPIRWRQCWLTPWLTWQRETETSSNNSGSSSNTQVRARLHYVTKHDSLSTFINGLGPLKTKSGRIQEGSWADFLILKGPKIQTHFNASIAF